MKTQKLCLWRLTTIAVIFSVLVFASPRNSFADTQLFLDDFEDTTLDAWVVSPAESWTNGLSSAHSGTRKARVSGNVEGATLTRMQSTSGYNTISVTFWHDTSTGWDSQDLLEMQWTADNGTTWMTAVTLDGDDLTPMTEGGEDWIEHVALLPASATDNSEFGVRFNATIGGQTDLMYVDDVRIGGEPTGGSVPTPTPTSVVTPSPTPTVTNAPTPTPTQVAQPTPTPTVQPTVTPTATPTPTPVDQPDAPEQYSIRDLIRLLFRLLFRNWFSLMWYF